MTRFRQVAIIILVSSLCSLGGYIPVRIAIARKQAPIPEVIFVVGGTPDRERKAAQLAQVYPNLEVWVSSGTLEAKTIFREAGIAPDRLRFDNQAIDTVTNFTSIVDLLKQRKIQHLYLVTSDFHLSRSTAIATIVLGSQGIAFTAVPAHNPFYATESPLRTLRDVGRSLMWLAIRQTGAELKQ